MVTLNEAEDDTMRIRLQSELLLLNILAILLIIVISFFPSSVLRIILGLPFVLFFPGYTLVAALFPRRSPLDSIERVGLSFGLSIAVVPLIGLILNYTPWGIRLYPVLVSLVIFILGTSVTREQAVTGIQWWSAMGERVNAMGAGCAECVFTFGWQYLDADREFWCLA